MIYQGSEIEISGCKIPGSDTDQVPLILSILFFSSRVAETFLRMHSVYPLNFATYLGADSNGMSFKVGIFIFIVFDLFTK